MMQRRRLLPGEAIERAAADFGLGGVVAVHALKGGSTVAYLVATERGQFVLHQRADARDALLYRRVERHLKERGTRQARAIETARGEVANTEHWTAQEHIDGSWVLRPDEAQSLRFAAYLARYHAALAELDVPGWLRVLDTPWRRADSLDHGLGELHAAVRATEPIDTVRSADRRCAERIVEVRDLLDGLTVQLIHADASSDNILWSDDGPVLIDFTPYEAHHLYSLAVSQFCTTSTSTTSR